jgi:hypothetical protein
MISFTYLGNSLLPWANEQEKNQNVQNGQKMILMSIMKVS